MKSIGELDLQKIILDGYCKYLKNFNFYLGTEHRLKDSLLHKKFFAGMDCE